MPLPHEVRSFVWSLAIFAAISGCGLTVPTDFGDLPDASTPGSPTPQRDAGVSDEAAALSDATSATGQSGGSDAGDQAIDQRAPADDSGPADASTSDDAPEVDDASDGAIPSDLPPQSGPILDGSCRYDASFVVGDGAADDNENAGDANASIPPGHRSAVACCPVARDPGGTCAPDAATAPSSTCTSDSDCRAGTNGRCYVVGEPLFGVPPGWGGVDAGPVGLLMFACLGECTYDQCFSDDDCPDHVPCDCRVGVYGINTCRTGSRCNVDSDCGHGGYCTPYNGVYYCHRPGDPCFTDADCPQDGFGAKCAFDTDKDHWECLSNPPPP